MPKTAHGHDTRYVRLQKNFCFACGKNNLQGMRLNFTYDEERDCFVCRFRLGKRYAGPPGHCHGGIIEICERCMDLNELEEQLQGEE